jgi:hypothetical protein
MARGAVRDAPQSLAPKVIEKIEQPRSRRATRG